jgi:hypothetical protein
VRLKSIPHPPTHTYPPITKPIPHPPTLKNNRFSKVNEYETDQLRVCSYFLNCFVYWAVDGNGKIIRRRVLVLEQTQAVIHERKIMTRI